MVRVIVLVLATSCGTAILVVPVVLVVGTIECVRVVVRANSGVGRLARYRWGGLLGGDSYLCGSDLHVTCSSSLGSPTYLGVGLRICNGGGAESVCMSCVGDLG